MESNAVIGSIAYPNESHNVSGGEVTILQQDTTLEDIVKAIFIVIRVFCQVKFS